MKQKHDYHPARLDEIHARLRAWEQENRDILESGKFERSIPAFRRLLGLEGFERKEPRKKKRQFRAGLPSPQIETTVIPMQCSESRDSQES